MELPESLKPFQQEAERYLSEGLVRDIQFSGATYQILIKDRENGSDCWTFLQLDAEGNLKDFFCDAEEYEEFDPCVHLCAAYLKIYGGHSAPLHKRFARSLWHHICYAYLVSLGDDATCLKAIKQSHYKHQSTSGKLLVELEGHRVETSRALKQMIHQHRSDTEETSLKFSNLSQDEIMMWREGRPSENLKYELSFWSDLAKMAMLLQEAGEPYEIRFEYAPSGLPNGIHIHFTSLSMFFYISEANLPMIIPSLVTVKSPIPVYDAPKDEIKKIVYDKKAVCFYIQAQKVTEGIALKILEARDQEKGIPIEDWVYIPQEGFYAKDPHRLLKAGTISSHQISSFLNKEASLIRPLFEGATLHKESFEISYAIAFDNDWNLRINAYLFTPGDLNFADSYFFGDWAYIDDDGFYKLEEMPFKEIETVISPDKLPEFITKHRTWLNLQEGFHVHPSSFESQLHYEVNKEGRLSFLSGLDLHENQEEMREFSPWIYLAGQGFYAKEGLSRGQSLRAGVTLPPEQVPLFIKVNRDELQQISGFFSQKSPVASVGVKIKLQGKDRIFLSPVYQLTPAYQTQEVLFYDDFTFVRGEGFHELPIELRLPERYSHSTEIEKDNLEFFLTQELEPLRERAVSIDIRLTKPKTMHLISSQIDKQTDRDNPLEYIVKLRYETEMGSIPVTEIWTAIKRKKKFLFSAAGLIDLHERRFDWVRWLNKDQVHLDNRSLDLSTVELMRLYALEGIECPLGKTDEQKRSFEFLNELIQLKPPKEPDLLGLVSHLRPYQKNGVQWLWFLYHYGLSGLLCDDMGLGKTHQTMAIIASLFNEKRSTSQALPHVLIVCPTSVIYHWQEKLAAFLPDFRVYTYYGSERTLEGFKGEYDILLTSYGISRIENEVLKELFFELAIFDEIQLAKNHNSRLYASLLKLNAKMRVGLTGTPIENHLRELKALFDIVLPAYMPTESDYRDFFARPIEREGDLERKKLLSRMIKPFVLRRRKEEVLPDLPEKIEEISHCDLLPTQANLYNEVLIHGRARILDELQNQSSSVPYVHIFSLLSALKQICNHPAVYLKQPSQYREYESGKWELFVELLNEARESSQKVVIFSQYLMMMDIIEDYLSEIGVGFAAIRGATQNRGQQLHRFKHDPACEVFVASLQAAGLGVDLTSASVVIHYDRWWNAARENQATDRVHRIGQTRGVQVFKLVTKDTFEERIDALIRRKGSLLEEVVGVDDHQIIKRFSREELIQFLQETKSYTSGHTVD